MGSPWSARSPRGSPFPGTTWQRMARPRPGEFAGRWRPFSAGSPDGTSRSRRAYASRRALVRETDRRAMQRDATLEPMPGYRLDLAQELVRDPAEPEALRERPLHVQQQVRRHFGV